jgi:hypothetical protein
MTTQDFVAWGLIVGFVVLGLFFHEPTCWRWRR